MYAADNLHLQLHASKYSTVKCLFIACQCRSQPYSILETGDRRKTKITHLIPFNILHHLWLQKLASTGTDRVHLLEGEREKSYFLRERTLLSFYGWLLYFFHDEYMMLLVVNTPRTPLSAKLVEDVWNSSFLTFKLFVDVKCSVSGFLLNQIELSAESMFACK